MELRAQRIGYLVPGPSFSGTVQSVFARACNIASGGLLLTIAAPDVADGPTTLVLDGERIIDLRFCFKILDTIVRHGDRVTSPCGGIDLMHAASWHPASAPAVADRAQVATNFDIVAARLAARLHENASIIHRAGQATSARIVQACRERDCDSALREAVGLIGWGEGLTPAGDDFLVGMLAALDALARRSATRAAFLRCLGARLAAHAHRTTDIAAHYLRLAAGGHFSADIHRLRGALLSSTDVARVAKLADDSLAIGATSGADLVAGLLAGTSAWLPAYSLDERSDDD